MGFLGVEDELLARLAGFVAETSAKIVLTSTWKDKFMETGDFDADFMYLVDRLEQFGLELSGFTGTGDRGPAVRKWLDGHPGPKKVIIFDDEWKLSFCDLGLGKYLVQTTDKTGLTDANIRYARRLLERQRKMIDEQS